MHYTCSLVPPGHHEVSVTPQRGQMHQHALSTSRVCVQLSATRRLEVRIHPSSRWPAAGRPTTGQTAARTPCWWRLREQVMPRGECPRVLRGRSRPWAGGGLSWCDPQGGGFWHAGFQLGKQKQWEITKSCCMPFANLSYFFSSYFSEKVCSELIHKHLKCDPHLSLELSVPSVLIDTHYSLWLVSPSL